MPPTDAVAAAESHRSRSSVQGPSAGNRKVSHSAHEYSFQGLLKGMSPKQLLHVAHRLIIIASAVLYLIASVNAFIAVIHLLSGTQRTDSIQVKLESSLIQKYVGTERIRSSPLVMNTLGGHTSPRNGTLYLETNGTSFDGCHDTVNANSALVYSDTLLRSTFNLITSQTKYYNTVLDGKELIMPVVDCSFPTVATGDLTLSRSYALARSTTDSEDVYLLSAKLSMQDYSIEAQDEVGPIGLCTFAMINDVRETNVTSYYAGAIGYPYELPVFLPYALQGVTSQGFSHFATVPKYPLVVASKDIYAARRQGVYVTAETERSNIVNLFWIFQTNAMDELTTTQAAGVPVLANSWAWVHAVHIYFAIDGVINLLVLMLIMYRNLCKGKIWVGDAFVSISTTLFTRGLIIFIGWCLESFWTLLEFCISASNEIAGIRDVPYYSAIVHADLMTAYLFVLTVIGYALQERIDPALALIVYEIAWSNRIALIGWFPGLQRSLIAFAQADAALSVVSTSQSLDSSPMRMWTIHTPSSSAQEHIITAAFPIFFTMVVHIIYALIRKVYHHFHPEKLHIQKSSGATARTANSEDERSLLSQKRTLTLFEIATGAALQHRMGVVADYENCWFIKGMKYASADGIYSSGFVIANGKFLIATADLPVIIAMKAIRVRFQNIHVFEVTGSTVKQTAQLVYPQTISWADLVHLNLSVLS